MKTRIFKGILSVFIIFLIFQSVNIVKADDDYEYNEHEEHERYEKDEDEWGDEDESVGIENRTLNQENQVLQSYWNIWTRDTSPSFTENLPFQESKEIVVENSGESDSFYVIPLNGQFLISGEKMAQLLGVKYKFYKESRISEVSNDKEELIVRAGSNAAFENMVKTPMPANPLYFENSIFLPISVIANAFSYRVNWDQAKGTIILNKNY